MRITTAFADGHTVEGFEKRLADLGARKGQQALTRAIRRTQEKVRTDVTRAIVRQSSIPRARVRKSIALRRPQPVGAGVEGIVESTGSQIPLKEFGARQFAYGVRAKVYGKSTRFPGMFIMGGTPSSGRPADQGHVLLNTREHNPKSGRENMPRRQFGPSVPEEMVKNEAKTAFENAVATTLPRRLDHEIARLID